MKTFGSFSAALLFALGIVLGACGSSGGGSTANDGSNSGSSKVRTVTGSLSDAGLSAVDTVRATDETGASYSASVSASGRAAALTSSTFSLSLPVDHYYSISFLLGSTTVSSLAFNLGATSSASVTNFYLSDSTDPVDLGTVQSQGTGTATPQNNPLAQNDHDHDGIHNYDDMDDDDDGIDDWSDDDYSGSGSGGDDDGMDGDHGGSDDNGTDDNETDSNDDGNDGHDNGNGHK